jgi:hypothetical protein
MNALQQYLSRAAAELDLRIEIEPIVTLSDGRSLRAQVRFPDLGNSSGALVFSFGDLLDRRAREDLKAQGYSMSTMSGAPAAASFDIDSLKETFLDWGWFGDPALTPNWLKEPPPIGYH